MADSSTVDDLLARLHAAREQNTPLTPEEVCHDHPHLLDAVRRYWGGAELIHRARSAEATPRPLCPLTDEQFTITHPEPIDRGGMGLLFAARDVRMGREVVVKRPLPDKVWTAGGLVRFVREAKITARLAHPGVVPVYGIGEDADGRPYYAMHWVRGKRTLADAIRDLHQAGGCRPSDPSFRKLLRQFIDVCEVVAHAHREGDVHRDIKPKNVMLDASGQTYLVDWGLAKSTADRSPDPIAPSPPDEPVTFGAVGTKGYMAPEVATAAEPTTHPTADIYSLGATLYHLLTGHVYGQQVPHAAPSPPPAALLAVAAKAMRERPEERYATAEELAAEVEAFLADHRVAAYREPLLARLGRWSRRHPGIVSGVVAAAVITALGVGIGAAVVNGKNQELATTNGDLNKANVDLDAARREATESAASATREAKLNGLASYTSSLQAASELTYTRPLAALEVLNEVKAAHPSRPEFGWSLLHSAADCKRSVPTPHAGGIEAVVFSPDGKYLATGGLTRGEVCVWEVGTWKRVARWGDFAGAVNSLAFSPDGRKLAVGCGTPWRPRTLNGQFVNGKFVNTATMKPGDTAPTPVRIVDALTGKVEKELEGHKYGVLSVAWSPLGVIASGGEDGAVRLWDAVDGEPLANTLSRKNVSVVGVGFADQGRQVVAGWDDGTVRVWAIGGGDGLRAALGVVAGARATIGPLASPVQLKEILSEQRPHEGSVTCLTTAIQQAGYISGGIDSWAVLSPTATQRVIPLEQFPSNVWSVASDHESNTIAMSAGESLRVWHTPPGKAPNSKDDVKKLEFETGRGKLAVHPTRPIIVVGHEGRDTLSVLDLSVTPNGTMKHYHQWNYDQYALSADGSRLASSSRNTFRIELHDPVTMEVIRETPRLEEWTDQVSLSADGRRLYSLHTAPSNADKQKSVPNVFRCWDTETMTELWAVTPGGKRWRTFSLHEATGRVALAGLGNEVEILDLTTRTVVDKFSFASGQVDLVEFSPDGRHLAAGCRSEKFSDSVLRVWELATRKETVRSGPAIARGVERLNWGSRGAHLFAKWRMPDLRRDEPIIARNWGVWAIPSGEALEPTEDANSQVTWAEFSPTGDAIVLARADRRVVRLALPSGNREWVSGQFEQPVSRMAWSPDGRTLAAITTGGGMGYKSYLFTLDPVLGKQQVRLPIDNWEDCNLLRFMPDSSALIACRKWRLHCWKPGR